MLTPKEEIILLLRLPGVGVSTYWKLVERFGSVNAALQLPISTLAEVVPKEALAQLKEFKQLGEKSFVVQQVRQDVTYADYRDIHILDSSDMLYPELLRQITRPPPLLFIAGDAAVLSLPQIAVVGSRHPTAPGKKTAKQFAAHLAAAGFTITSGLALGVDASAHQGALGVSGRTIAVLGTGIDQIYPYRNRALAEEIIAKGGALVSEFPLGTSALPANFPQRNRIISGLSCGTLVIEAALQSGSLITARYAVQQNREVFAIPGSIHSPVSKGCHKLIKNGAKLVETADDIVEELQGLLQLQWEQVSLPSTALDREPAEMLSHIDPPDGEHASEQERLVLSCLGHDPSSIDELVERTQLPVGEVMANLMTLELKGRIGNNGTGYVLMGRPV